VNAERKAKEGGRKTYVLEEVLVALTLVRVLPLEGVHVLRLSLRIGEASAGQLGWRKRRTSNSTLLDDENDENDETHPLTLLRYDLVVERRLRYCVPHTRLALGAVERRKKVSSLKSSFPPLALSTTRLSTVRAMQAGEAYSCKRLTLLLRIVLILLALQRSAVVQESEQKLASSGKSE
jgi:hypothetical protein